jgi:hypothetical protein
VIAVGKIFAAGAVGSSLRNCAHGTCNGHGNNQERAMGVCDPCGNVYDKTFSIRQGDREATYDSFECAVHGFAPRCAHCGCPVLGHGIEEADSIFCCGHCARSKVLKDRG